MRFNGRITTIAVFLGLAVGLTACFQSAGTPVEPTIANVTATLSALPPPTATPPPVGGGLSAPPSALPSATPFITPMGTDGFVVPTLDLNATAQASTPLSPTPAVNASASQTPQLFPPTPTPPVIPSVAPVQPSPGPTLVPTLPLAGSPIADATIAPIPTLDPNGLAATPTALATDSPCEYTVQRNDTFYAIARKLNVDVQDLLRLNPRANPGSLSIGERLALPCKAQATPGNALTLTVQAGGTGTTPTLPSVTGSQTYTIVAGDTLGRIAARFGVTVQELVRANNLPNENAILNVGQKLIIPARTP